MTKPPHLTDEEWTLRLNVSKLETRYNKTIELHERKLKKLKEEIRKLEKSCNHRLTTYHPQQYDSYEQCDICKKYNPPCKNIKSTNN